MQDQDGENRFLSWLLLFSYALINAKFKRNSGEKHVTLKEAQELLEVLHKTILRWIGKRNMPAYKARRLWKF